MYRKTLLAIAATFTTLGAFTGTIMAVTGGSPAAVSAQQPVA
jgi:hypothetical protein